MKEPQGKSFLENLTNILVLTVAVVALCLLGLNFFTSTRTPEVQSGLERRMQFPILPTVAYDDFNATLLIALNTDCGYCNDSVPFYKRLLDQHRRSDRTVNIVALFPNPKAEVEAYLKQHQLEVFALHSVRFDQIKLSGTPSLVLLDRNGRLTDFWIGNVSANEEQQVANTVLSLGVANKLTK